MSRKCQGCRKWLTAGQYTCPFCGRGEDDQLNDLEKENNEKLQELLSRKVVDATPVLRLLALIKELDDSMVNYALGCCNNQVLSELCKRQNVVSSSEKFIELVEKAEKCDACIRLEERQMELKSLILEKKGKTLEAFQLKKRIEEVKEQAEEERSWRSFLHFVLETCDLKAVSKSALERARKVESITMQEHKGDGSIVRAGDAGEKISVDHVRGGEMRALKASYGEEEDGLFGSDRGENDDYATVSCEIQFNRSGVVISGSLTNFIRSASVHQGGTNGYHLCDLVKDRGKWLLGKGKVLVLDAQNTYHLELRVLFFPQMLLTGFGFATYRMCLSLDHPKTILQFPKPMSTSRGLLNDCLTAMTMQQANVTPVTFERLQTRVVNAIHFCLGEPHPSPRHVWSLQQFLLMIQASIAKLNTFYLPRVKVASYIPLHSEWPKVTFSKSKMDDECVPGLADELINVMIAGGTDQIRNVLNHVGNEYGRQIHPMAVGGVARRVYVSAKGIITPSFREDSMSFSYRQKLVPMGHVNMQGYALLSDLSMKRLVLTFLMGKHKRLGEASPIRLLPKDIIQDDLQTFAQGPARKATFVSPC